MSNLVIDMQFEFPEINNDETIEWNLQNMMKNVKVIFPKKDVTYNKPKINISQYRAGYYDK